VEVVEAVEHVEGGQGWGAAQADARSCGRRSLRGRERQGRGERGAVEGTDQVTGCARCASLGRVLGELASGEVAAG
jgi:hypothetical protein